MKKRLYRSTTQKMVAGVCGGLAEYFNMDATIIRLIWVLAIPFSAGTALLIYLIAAIIMPKGEGFGSTVVEDEDGNTTYVHENTNTGSSTRSNSLLFFGGLLVVIGGLVLLDQFVPFIDFLKSLKGYVWPLILILIGLVILLSSLRNRE